MQPYLASIVVSLLTLAPAAAQGLSQSAYAKASNTEQDDSFGFAVAVDGDTMVVGAPFEDSAAVGVDGDGADNSATDSGAAYVYRRGPEGWEFEAYLKASNTESNDFFGHAVAVAGDRVFVGAPEEDSPATGINGEQGNGRFTSGAVYVFVRGATGWEQEAYLKASNTDSSDQFGWSLAADGRTLAVGAWLESSSATGVGGDESDNGASSSGAVYVFVRNGASWSQQEYIKASNTDPDDVFGYSVALHDDTLVVGARAEDSLAIGVDGDETDNTGFRVGAAYVFTRSGSLWDQQAYLKPFASGDGDRFGESVAVHGEVVAVGAHFERSAVPGDPTNNDVVSGAAYTYVRDGASWSTQSYLKSPEPGSGDQFGLKVALDGELLVVGVPRADSITGSIVGDPFNDDLGDSGSLFFYLHIGNAWVQVAYIKAAAGERFDQMGAGLALDGGTVVAGAIEEDSSAVGIDGDQSNNGASNSGAAYVFAAPVFCSQETSYGLGTQGSGGVIPSLRVSSGPPVVPNPAFALEAEGLLGGAPCAYVLGRSPIELELFGATILADPERTQALLASGSGPGAGTATFAIPIPDDPSVVGFEFFAQVVAIDVAGSPGGLSASAAIRFRLCDTIP